MKYLFRKAERNAVEDKFGDSILFEALRVPCTALMNEAASFALHPSDLFYHVMFTIDEMKSRGVVESKRYFEKTLWDDLLSNFREHAGDEHLEEEKRAVCEVMYAVSFVLLWSERSAYTSLVGMLMRQIEIHVPGYADGVEKKFKDGFTMARGTALRDAIVEYLDSEMQISLQTEQLLDELPSSGQEQMPISAESPKINRTGDLTIGQLVILFSSLLGVGLNPNFDNQSSLADFISHVSGFDAESIRQKIMQLAKSKKSTKQIKSDAEKVARMLDLYKPQLASEIRDKYIDEE